MTSTHTPRTPLSSARPATRPASATSSKSVHVQPVKNLTLPPMKVDYGDAKPSSRQPRPASSGGVSPGSARSSTGPLSARIKQSPYAMSLSARAQETKPQVSARKIGSYSSRAPTSADHSLSTGHFAPEPVAEVHVPLTPPAEPLTPPHAGIDSCDTISHPTDEKNEEPELSLDVLLESEGLEPVMEVTESVLPDPMDDMPLVESVIVHHDESEQILRAEDVPIPSTPEDFEDHVEEPVALADADHLEPPVTPESVVEPLVERVHLSDEPAHPQTPAEPVVDLEETKIPESGDAAFSCESAVSSVYCGHSTIIGSIPEDVGVPEHSIDDAIGDDRAAAPSPPEPSPTPQTREEADSPSPILPPLNVSQYSAVTIDDPAKISTDVQVTARFIAAHPAPGRAARKKESLWRRIFCCGGSTV